MPGKHYEITEATTAQIAAPCTCGGAFGVYPKRGSLSLAQEPGRPEQKLPVLVTACRNCNLMKLYLVGNASIW